MTEKHHQTLSEPSPGVCMMCGKLEPVAGWHTVGFSDGDLEFFCSAQCFNENVDGYGDDEDGPEPSDECGRWINGRLGHSCAKAGTEECDFECPYR